MKETAKCFKVISMYILHMFIINCMFVRRSLRLEWAKKCIQMKKLENTFKIKSSLSLWDCVCLLMKSAANSESEFNWPGGVKLIPDV